jgi:hypothetical protein
MILNTTPIQMEWFYYLEGDKTKLNWYLLEFAMEYYENIRKSPALEQYRKRYDEQQIAQYCAYHARRMKKSFLNCLRGRTKHVIFYEGYISDFYPHHDNELNNTLNKVAMEAFENLQSGCEGCPQACISDYKAKCALFEEYEV